MPRVAAAALAASSVWGRPAIAQEEAASSPPAAASAPACTGTVQQCGRKAFEAATAAYAKGRFGLALEGFLEADRLTPHAAISFNIALTRAELGQKAAAFLMLERVLADPLTAPELAARVRKELSRIGRSVAVISTDGNRDRELVLRLNGKVVEGSEQRRVVEPGRYRIVLLSSGRPQIERSVELYGGERLTLSLAEPNPAPPPPKPQAKPRQYGVDPVFFWTGLGVSAALGGAALYSGLDTLKQRDAYTQVAPQLSDEQTNQQLKKGRDRDQRTNILAGAAIGAAAATASLGLFFTDFGGDDTVQVGVGLHMVHLRSRF